MYTRERILDAVENCLGENDRQIIISRFGIEDGSTRTLSEIEMTFGVTRKQVREIPKRLSNTGFPTLEDDASGSDASGIPKR